MLPGLAEEAARGSSRALPWAEGGEQRAAGQLLRAPARTVLGSGSRDTTIARNSSSLTPVAPGWEPEPLGLL